MFQFPVILSGFLCLVLILEILFRRFCLPFLPFEFLVFKGFLGFILPAQLHVSLPSVRHAIIGGQRVDLS